MTWSRYCVRLLALVLVHAVFAVTAAQASQLQQALDRIAAQGGGAVQLERGQTKVVDGTIVLPDGVTLDLNAGTLIVRLDGPDIAGVRMLSNSTLRNGSVRVRSRGYPGEQTGYHAAVLVGALYGERGEANRPSRFEAPVNWRIENVTARSDKWLANSGNPIGAAAIQVMGGARQGVISDVRVPDSARMAGGVMLDWGVVGALSSQDVTGSQRLHRTGHGYTSHPHDITIADIHIGRLTADRQGAPGTFGIRLSGAHDIDISRVRIDQTSGAAVLHHAGDLGYRFARPADRRRAHLGIRIAHVQAGVSGGYAFRSDTDADNIARALGGRHIAATDMLVTDFSARAMPGSGAVGLRIDRQEGGRFTDLAFAGFDTAMMIDERVRDIVIRRVEAHRSMRRAFVIGHPHRPPIDVTMADIRAYGNGAARKGVVARSQGVRLSNLIDIDLRVDDDARDLRMD